MNIFLTSPDPAECAKALDDRRLVKMVLETAQLLSTALREVNLDVGYRSTHRNHPCSVWARASRGNFLWLVEHGLCLSHEYKRRYGKTHASERVVIECYHSASAIPQGNLSFTFDCSGQNVGTVFDNYRECLRQKWINDGKKARWTRRSQPQWRFK